MKIVHIDFTGTFNETMSYQENIIPKYNAKDGHEVIMITTCYEWDNEGKVIYSPSVDKMMGNGVRLIRLEYVKIINKFITSKIRRVNNFYMLLKQLCPDIIFVHGLQTFELLTVVKYIKRNPLKKLLIDNHADFSNSASNILSKYILHKIIWRYFANYAEPYTSKFYGVLPARVDFLINIYKLPRNKCELLIMGADDEKVFMSRNSNIRQQIRNELGISESDFLIITGGKIDIEKKQTITLLRAIHELNIPNVKLLLFGSIIKELKKEIDQFVDNKRIHYIGWINSEDVYNYFVASELAIFPGRHSVLWEQAVGTGIPCIFKYWIGTTHVDVSGNCKFLYSDQVEEIKTILREIFFDKEIYNGMKKVAEEAGIKKFSYREISKKSIE